MNANASLKQFTGKHRRARVLHMALGLVTLTGVLSSSGIGIAADAGPGSFRHGGVAPRVVLFERPGFRGESIELRPGEEFYNLGKIRFSGGRKANDAVSSVLIEGGAILVVHTDADFSGESLKLTESVPNLDSLQRSAGQNWNDTISSARAMVEQRAGRRDPRDREPRVIVYRGAHFGGETLEVYPGESLDNLSNVDLEGGRDANDAISSIRLVGPVRVRIYSAAGYREHTLEVTEDLDDLLRVPRGPGGRMNWNDCISSMKVDRVEAPPPPPPPPPVGDGRDDTDPPRIGELDAMIRTVHLEVLERDATRAELATYRRRVVREGWTEEMIRAELRGSREYRQIQADADIRLAYTELLGREPRTDEIESYRSLILDRGWTAQMVRDAILRSPEYRNRQRNPSSPRR